MRVLGRKKDGSLLMATDQEIIQNALDQEKRGIDPHYAFIDYKTKEQVAPLGWLVWSLLDGGCGVVFDDSSISKAENEKKRQKVEKFTIILKRAI